MIESEVLEDFKRMSEMLAEKDMLIKYGKEEIKKLHKRINEIVERDSKVCQEKDQQIQYLQERLKNAIVPKFKIGQEVFYIGFEDIIDNDRIKYFEYNSTDNSIFYKFETEISYHEENSIFATETEAEQRLKERRGEIKC